jgi:hypothetical protein
MVRTLWGVILLIVTVGISACGGGDSMTSPEIGHFNLVTSAVKSVPLNNPSSSVSQSLRLFDRTHGLTITDPSQYSDTWLTGPSGVFKLECHMEGGLDVCPTGVTRDMNTKFSIVSMVGKIYHVGALWIPRIYGKTPPTVCDEVSGGEALKNQTPSFQGSSKFYLTMANHYDCYKKEEDSSYGNTLYYLYKGVSASESDRVYSMLYSSYLGADSGNKSSNFFQAYGRADSAGSMKISAINMAHASTMYDRFVMIMNPQLNRFIMKSGPVVALGKGGFDPTTGSFYGGVFVAKTEYSSQTSHYCMQQSTDGTFSVKSDSTTCTSNADLGQFFTSFFDGTDF